MLIELITRWRMRGRIGSQGAGNRAQFGFLTLAHLLQWRLTDGSIEKGSRNWLPDAGASVIIALDGRHVTLKREHNSAP
jgi:hypothetical protein